MQKVHRLGRKAVKTDSRTRRMTSYFSETLPAPPPTCDWTKGVKDWGMMLNDTLGDCTIAGLGHAIQVWSLNTGTEVTIQDNAVEAAYSAWDGYVQGDSSTDNGGVELDVLTNFKRDGLAGNKLIGFADPNLANLTEVKQSIALFGGVYIGVSLPATAQGQDQWQVIPDDGSGNAEPGSWGGHCVFVPAYNNAGFVCITWGKLMPITYDFWRKYVDEAHTLLSPNWIAANGSPSGFNLDQLTADIAAIR